MDHGFIGLLRWTTVDGRKALLLDARAKVTGVDHSSADAVTRGHTTLGTAFFPTDTRDVHGRVERHSGTDHRRAFC